MPKERSISVGYASAVVKPHDDRKGYVVEKVWVDPEHRGNGAARQLMEEIDRKFQHHDLWLKPRPYSEMGAELGATIDQLKRFYQSFGFEPVDDKDNMVRRGQPRLRRKTAALYHGSPRDLEVLSPSAEHGDPRVRPAVFASPSRTFALAYSGDKWGDRDLNQTATGGPTPTVALREMRPGALQQIYDRPGHLYEVPHEPFQALKGRRTMHEVVSYDQVTPLKHEQVGNVLQALRADPTVTLHEYEPNHPDTRAAIQRQVKRMAEMTPEGAAEYRKWRTEVAPPEIKAMLEQEERNYARAREKTAELAEDGEHELDGHIDFQGLRIAVENRKGSVRSGTTPDGHEWHTKMKAPYGYIEAPAKGRDGESIDVYVGPKKDADTAFVVHQHKPDGTGHDEDKVILGVEDEAAARKLYLQHYDDPKFLGPMDAVPMERLRKMVEQHRKLTKIAFDEEDADKVLRVAKPRKLRISEDGYMSEMNPRSKTSPVVKSFLQKHVQVPGTAAGQQAFDMLVDDASFDPVDVRAGGRGTHGYIQTPKRGDSVDALRRLQREAAKSRYSDPADVGSLRAVATTEFTPPQRKMLNALAEGHELNELHYGNHGQTPARFVDGLEHAHPGVLLREHNAVATLPESMSPIRKAMAGMRSLESPMFEPYGVRLGNSGRLSRHAIKRISEDITRGGPQRAFDSMHDFVQRMHAAQAAKGITLKIAGVSSPGATVKFKMPGVSVPSLKIKSGVPTISAPSVKSPPGTPQL